MGILAWIILGALAGWIASIIMKKDAKMGAFANIAVGIVGAFIGGLVMNLLGGWGVTGFNLWSLIVSIIGAVIFLWVINLIQKKM